MKGIQFKEKNRTLHKLQMFQYIYLLLRAGLQKNSEKPYSQWSNGQQSTTNARGT
jgi:hypothetical protein